jgi:phosphoglycerate dehydrogenase-like enzyme
MVKPQALVVMDQRSFTAHFDRFRLDRLHRLVTPAAPLWVHELGSADARHLLATAEVLITSWGAPTLTADVLAAAPALQAVFHAAGSVRPIVSDSLWARGIRVTSAAEANAVPVAEYTLAAVIAAGKKAVFPQVGTTTGYGHRSNYHRTVGVVGFSRVGRRVVDLLGVLDLAACLVADPHADATEVGLAGGTLLDLHDMLPRTEILTLHAPALPSTRHLIGARELALLPDHATIVNTARGSLIDTDALVRECASGRLFAILDVTEPEPLPPEHPLLHLPTVVVTPHLAGATGSEVLRLSDLTLDELGRWVADEPLLAEVTPADLALRA